MNKDIWCLTCEIDNGYSRHHGLFAVKANTKEEAIEKAKQEVRTMGNDFILTKVILIENFSKDTDDVYMF